MIIDSCRILDSASEYGCYLCSKYRLAPTDYQDFALFSSPFANDVQRLCIQNIFKAKKASSGNVLVFVPKNWLFEIVEGFLNNSKPRTLSKNELSTENDLLARFFFDREK
jgi:hypothetical protein